MKPLDPRLLRYARSTRVFLIAMVGLGLLTAALVITQAIALGHSIARAFAGGESLSALAPLIGVLAAVVLARALTAWATELAAHRASAGAKSQLRAALLAKAIRLGPAWLTGERTGTLTTLATRGVDGLDDYFARYLPQLVLACIVPVAIVCTLLVVDPWSALIVLVTIPLIPLFLAIIGTFTRARVDRQWRTLAVLSGHFLDVVAGLPTLRAFGRSHDQEQRIEAVGDDYRTTTMGVLRVSFLSSLVLEIGALLSVALVAVSIGLRLVDGRMTLAAGLTALLLAPEAYQPIRLVGQYFHAAAEGVGAAEQVFAVLELSDEAEPTSSPVPDLTRSHIVIDNVTVTYPNRSTPGLRSTRFELHPGTITALVGPSGSGKSTLLSVLLDFRQPTSGHVQVITAGNAGIRATLDLVQIDPDAWRAQIAYVGQNVHLVRGTIADNVRLGAPEASDDQVREALRAAGLDLDDPAVVATLPAGLETHLSTEGAGLSAGQRRRVGLARALCRNAPLVLLDEPTAALDGATEDCIAQAVRALADAGRTVLLVAHRPALVLMADQVVTLDASAQTEIGANEVAQA